VEEASWSSLVIQGGEDFINTIAELHFLTTLNRIQCALKKYGPLMADPNNRTKAVGMIDAPIVGAEVIMRAGYWKEGHTFRPSDTHLAKLRFRQAYFLRLAATTGHATSSSPDGPVLVEALQAIGDALLLLPDDRALLRERDAISDCIKRSCM